MVGGAPYGCNLLPNSNRFPAGKQTCQFPPKNTDWPAHIRRMDRYISRHAKESLIDPTSFLHGTRVVLFSSSEDTVVLQPVMRAAATQVPSQPRCLNSNPRLSLFSPLLSSLYDLSALSPSDSPRPTPLCQLSSYMSGGGNLEPVFSVPCQHSWPTDDPTMDAASHDGVPFINDCQYDLAGISLRHMLNRSLSPRVAAKEGHLYKVSQRSFIPRGTIVIDGTEMNTVVASQLDDTALLYVPLSCARTDGPSCAIHVHYHGCTLEYPNWSAMHLGLHDWAEANEIVVLHPRVRWIYSGPLSNYGCWDWEGSTGAGFDTHEGLQLRTVINMLEAIGRLGGAQFVERYPVS